MPKLQALHRKYKKLEVRAFIGGPNAWLIYFYKVPKPGQSDQAIAEAVIDDQTGAVVAVWTGYQVLWPMARGVPEAFGRVAAEPYVWGPLLAIFLLPFLRLPLRLLHLDLLVLMSFAVSYYFFSVGRVGVSTPLIYPPLLYLLLRMVILAFRHQRSSAVTSPILTLPRWLRSVGTRIPLKRVPSWMLEADRTPKPLQLALPTWLIAIGVFLLSALHVALNIIDSNVIDVGYSGIIGADHLIHGKQIYGTFPFDDSNGDTYGPVNYYAYVPFVLMFPWHGAENHLQSAHAAALFFDFASALLLWLLGRRFAGTRCAWLLTYLWLAFPFTLIVSNSNANDALVSALTLLTVLVLAYPFTRGVMIALAGFTKFAPLALAPLVITHPEFKQPSGHNQNNDIDSEQPGKRNSPKRSLHPYVQSLIGFVLASIVVMLIVLIPDKLKVFYQRTIAFQENRNSPFSLWSLVDAIHPLEYVVAAAVVVMAFVLCRYPRHRNTVTFCALAAAILIGVEIALDYWFYLYLVWFLPLVLFALLVPLFKPHKKT